MVAFHFLGALLVYITQFLPQTRVSPMTNVTPGAASPIRPPRLFVERRNTPGPVWRTPLRLRNCRKMEVPTHPSRQGEPVPCPKTVRLNSVFFLRAGAI